ncbi:lysoplasmalogenase [Pseudomonas auratipiscis]|uniref:Lysoplasmalogenase n=1 Tax=Pseudomonas auratipiscis TaxID=3115853 RepID=A0AB35WV31_9PSED|nr:MULTISPECIES: lysoplasmalogenase [unclassified Pseudomonas]MEE1868556.1 lysoplasmalogenase [Pseudomonas sp. 120P]MEE1959217.1 lysoplasmalogenase [Pseudomonas sp. 119P]
MPRPLTLLCLALLGAAFYLYALASDNALLGLAVKPIPVLALIAWLYAAEPGRYRRWITVGLAFSLLGDVLLAVPGDLFVFGLAAFLFAHLAYLRAYLNEARQMATWALAISLIVGAALLTLLISHGLGELLIPVTVYALAISAMLWRALACGGIAALGAIAFVFSDSLIGIDRFVGHFEAAPYLIILAYWLGQWAIAASVYTNRGTKTLIQTPARQDKFG